MSDGIPPPPGTNVDDLGGYQHLMCADAKLKVNKRQAHLLKHSKYIEKLVFECWVWGKTTVWEEVNDPIQWMKKRRERKDWIEDSEKCFTKVPSIKGKRMIILYGLHQDTFANFFENWYTRQLISNIPHQSVIVMDNAFCYSRQLLRVPDFLSIKTNIHNFLLTNDILSKKHRKKTIFIFVMNYLQNREMWY